MKNKRDTPRSRNLANVTCSLLTFPSPPPPPPGLTPLHAAAAGGHLEVADELISAGADVRRQAFVGSMPRHVAEREGHASMVELLVNAARSLEAGGFLESMSERGGKDGWCLVVVGDGPTWCDA